MTQLQRPSTSGAAFGAQVRSWRTARRLSQEALAERARVSTRHLSFVENGRSSPSRELVLSLSEALDVPLRDRNALLQLAGFAPAYRASSLEDAELRHLSRALDFVLAQQEPFGAVVLDGAWNILRANGGALRMLAHFPPRSADGVAAARNAVLGLLHPDAWRPYMVNWLEAAAVIVARLHRDAVAAPTPERSRLLAAALAMPEIPSTWRSHAPGAPSEPFVTVHLRSPTLEVRLFTMLTSIGTPLDITAAELHVESYFPADEATERALRALAPRSE